jgi:hypothetical protein
MTTPDFPQIAARYADAEAAAAVLREARQDALGTAADLEVARAAYQSAAAALRHALVPVTDLLDDADAESLA